MFEFAWPWSFLLLPLPWLLRVTVPPAKIEESAALKVPFFYEFENTPGGGRRTGFKPWQFVFALIVWCLLVLASARPQWLGEPIPQSVSGRDLLMAVDLSGSMQERDFLIGDTPIDRLSATKRVASQFIERRAGDRIGLILFGDQAYLQAPLTFDRTTVATFLDEAAIGLAGEKTAIGDAIGLAVKRLRNNPSNQRILILLTDGANTAGLVSPLKAAELAKHEGLKIYTIGIGADEMIIRDFFGSRRVNPSADLDEKTLTGIAGQTGGRYFRARDIRELETIYGLLDRLEPVEKDQQYYRPKIALYFWPLGLALILAFAFAGIKLGAARIPSIHLTRRTRSPSG
ncbi:MAG: VWA domain-containing protein [Methylococcaceae bacterium]|nr:VWA domain-containing protein [Methylococcaceae bacterium]MCI0733483.1 VWA domain-containing protein [Methylococcaceae bacterium]